ncbi:MAG: glycine betaine/L-proline ABC transporter substrate-binding protein ProX [Leptolyngbya sp. SIO3F4]|nr:glycine betaine/L-proline ABC transporter substrate-binding protein ProX [Leptolyngbya sp. SIO3F4]
MRHPLPDTSSYVVRLVTRWSMLIGTLSAITLFTGCQNITNENASLVTSDKVVRSAYASLEELFQTEIINIGLEKLGYKPITGSELEYDVIHQAIGRNYLDYTAVHWYPIHKDFFEQNGGNATFKRLEPVVENALQGYLIDKKTSTANNIDGLPDLQDPEIAKIFDTDGNGKANLIGCPHGWACRGVIESHLYGHNLRDTVEQDSHDYNASMEKIIERYKAGKPVLYFTWTPLWVSSVLVPNEDVVWLDVPPLGPQEDASIVDGKNLGFEINHIHILANRDFLKENSDIARWFEVVNIPITDVSLQNQRMRDGENKPEDIRRHAEEWILDNQGTFDSWLEDAKQSAKS